MKQIWREIGEWMVLLAIAWLASFLVRSYIVDTRVVPTGSMLPTIQLQDRLLVDKLFFKFTPLRRGDVVVFKAPPAADESDDLVKRIIGLPGETLAVHSGQVWINNQPLVEPYIAEPPNYTFGPVRIPAGAYFVMGDNRNNSKDSHVWGFLPEQNISGRVWLRYWPLNQFGHLAGIFTILVFSYSLC